MDSLETHLPNCLPSIEPLEICVYTAFTGQYERLNEQPMAQESTFPFICLTDDPELRSDTWQIQKVPSLFGMDPIRSQRDLKLRPHLHLPQYDFSIYIDNSVLLTQLPERVYERHFPASGFGLFRHSFRESVLDEFLEVARRGLAEQHRVFEQLNHFALAYPEILDQHPYWGGILLRDHRSPEVRAMLEIWFAHVLRYTGRDQLSMNIAFHKAGLIPDIMSGDNRASWFHTWPHADYRDTQKGSRNAAASMVPPVARVRQLEMELADARLLRDELLSSDAWRIGKWLDSRAKRHPRVVQKLRSATSLLRRDAQRGARTLQRIKERNRKSDLMRPMNQQTPRIIYVDPTDERGRVLAQKGGNLNPATVLMWRKLVASAAWTHLLDIGANYGEMLTNVDIPPGIKVIAVEPNPRILPYLRLTLSTASIKADVVAAACAEHMGVARLLVHKYWSGMSHLVEESNGEAIEDAELVSVPVTTIDALLGGPNTENDIRVLVKIDVEGQETSVLRGGAESLQRAKEFAILAELHHMTDDERTWLLEHFGVQLYDLKSDQFVDVDPATAEHLESMLADTRYYPNDAVLRRLA